MESPIQLVKKIIMDMKRFNLLKIRDLKDGI